MPGLLNFHRFTENIIKLDIIKSEFSSIQFTVTFAGTQRC